MAFKAISDDIIVQEGTFGFSFVASGTIYGGQLVKPAGPMQVVYSSLPTDNAIGVAAYDVTKGETVTVYCFGNIVRGHIPSTATSIGADLFAGSEGCFTDDFAYGGTSPSVGIVVDLSLGSGSAKILLK